MMRLVVVAVAAMSVVGEVSPMAMVEEVATVAAEEVDNGRCSWWLCSVIYFSRIFI